MRRALQALVFTLGMAGAMFAAGAPPATANAARADRPQQEAGAADDALTASRAALQRAGERASEVVLNAMHFIGVHYRRGGESGAAGFDCSGFTRYVFEHTLGLVLPRRADEQARAAGLVAVPRDQLQPGDLVFFNTLRRTFSHVGIYIGDNRFIHAPRPGGAVRTEDMNYAYWRQRYNGARRAELPAAAAEAAGASDPGG